MSRMLAHIALVVRDYDEAIEFYVGKLGFDLLDDTYQPEQDKRWVVVSPSGQQGCSILLLKRRRSARRGSLAIRQVGAFSFSCERMTFGGTTARS